MRIIVFAFVSLLFCQGIKAQKLSWKPNQIALQTRLFHKPNSQSYLDFKTNYDVSTGVNWQLGIGEKLNLNFGGTLNLSKHSRTDFREVDLYYIDFFKGSQISYFNITTISQFNFEMPINLSFNLKQGEQYGLDFYGGFIPQVLIASKANGSGLRTKTTGTFQYKLIADRIAAPTEPYKQAFINEVYLNGGFHFNRKVNTGNNIGIKVGYEYGTKGNSSGCLVGFTLDI